MKTASFFPWAKPVSSLGYGTTSFMSAGSTAARLSLLECAFNHGITHFDTAAYYGFGEAERLLGHFLRGRRDRVTITTKFGIEPSGAAKVRWINLAVRRVFAIAPVTRKLLKLRRPAQDSTWGVFEPEKAKASLDRSLLALGTDYVDLFLLHEPSLQTAGSEALIDFLEGEKQRGRIRAYGCGGGGQVMEAISSASLPTGQWLQFEDNAINRRLEQIQGKGVRCITFAPFNTALRAIQSYLETRPSLLASWSQRLGIDCSSPGEMAALLQATSHWRNPNGILLFSSANQKRIVRAAQIATGEVISKEQIVEFLQLTASLPGREGWGMQKPSS